MPNSNKYSELFRTATAAPDGKLRGDDSVIAPYENAVSELDDLIQQLDADVGDSAMNELRKMILDDADIPARIVAKVMELFIKDLLHIKHRLEVANVNHRKKRQGAGAQAQTKETA